MNTQIAYLEGEPCVLHWYDCHKQIPRNIVSKAEMDRSIVYERQLIIAQGVKPPAQPDGELPYTHAVATFRGGRSIIAILAFLFVSFVVNNFIST